MSGSASDSDEDLVAPSSQRKSKSHRRILEDDSSESDNNNITSDVIENKKQKPPNRLQLTSDSSSDDERTDSRLSVAADEPVADEETPDVSAATERRRRTRRNRAAELMAVHSESQRLMRETTLKLPYHVPQRKSLDEFLNRPKNVPSTLKPTIRFCGNIDRLAHTSEPKTQRNDQDFQKVVQSTSQSKRIPPEVLQKTCQPRLSGRPQEFILLDDPGKDNSGLSALIDRFMVHSSLSTSHVDRTVAASECARQRREEASEKHNNSRSELQNRLKSELLLKRAAAWKERVLLHEMEEETSRNFEAEEDGDDELDGDEEEPVEKTEEPNVDTKPVENESLDSSLELIGSLIPSHQPHGGMIHRVEEACPSNEESEISFSQSFLADSSQNDFKVYGISQISMAEDSAPRHEPSLFGTQGTTSQENMDELLELCSGKWHDDPSSNVVAAVPEDLAEKRSGSFSDSEAEICNSDDDSGSSIDLEPKKRTRILSDSEEEEECSEEEEEEENAADASTSPAKDSRGEEDETKKRRDELREYLDEEAELSGSEVSADEDEDDPAMDDVLLEELGGDLDDDVSEDELRNQIGKVHQKMVMDDDQRMLRIYKEMYLEDGELGDGTRRRIRRFRWRNGGNAIGDVHDPGSASENEADQANSSDEDLRMERVERTKWLREQGNLFAGNEEESLLNESLTKGFRLLDRTNERNVACPTPKDPSTIPMCGSILRRGPKFLARLAKDLSKSTADNAFNGARSTGNFVFAVISPTKPAKTGQRTVAAALPEPKRRRTDGASIFDFL